MQHVTKGTYQREVFSSQVNTFTAGSEFEISNLAAHAVASTASKDEFFSWIRCKAYVCSVAEGFCYEWMVIKCDAADALQDLNDAEVVEELHKEKRIFARGLELSCDRDSGGPIKAIKFELFNISLDYPEELRLVIRPITTTSADAGTYMGLLEWRQLGV